MRKLDDADWERVERLCRVLVTCPRGFVFIFNLVEAVRDGSYPVHLAADFLFDCAALEPELTPPCSWDDIRIAIARVACQPKNQAKYRFLSTAADYATREPFFIIDAEDALKRNGRRWETDMLKSPSVRPVASARRIDAVKTHLARLAARGQLGAAHEHEFLWIGTYDEHEKAAESGGASPSTPAQRVGRLSDELGHVHVAQGRIVAEIAVKCTLGELEHHGTKIRRATFAEGFDFELFRYAKGENGWGRAVHRARLCAATAPDDRCEGRAQLIIAGLAPRAPLAVAEVAQLQDAPRAGLQEPEFRERFRRHVKHTGGFRDLSEEDCVRIVLDLLYVRAIAGSRRAPKRGRAKRRVRRRTARGVSSLG